MPNNTSQHILNTSANLLGFCLFVITSLHITNKAETFIIDELTSIVGVLLVFSSLFSFFSIRTSHHKTERKLELLADYFFIVALIGILAIILFIAFNYIA